MSTVNADIRILYVDRGPISAAVRVLVEQSTLADYLTMRVEGGTFVIEPREGHYSLDMAGSGTQGLWRLLKAIAYSSHEVSLYEVLSRLDPRNRRAVAAAFAELTR